MREGGKIGHKRKRNRLSQIFQDMCDGVPVFRKLIKAAKVLNHPIAIVILLCERCLKQNVNYSSLNAFLDFTENRSSCSLVCFFFNMIVFRTDGPQNEERSTVERTGPTSSVRRGPVKMAQPSNFRRRFSVRF